VSVSSFNNTICRPQFPLQIKSCIHTIKFCSLLCVVVDHALLVVINIDSLMLGALCGKLHRLSDYRSHRLITTPHSSYLSRIAICAYPICIRCPRCGGLCRNITMMFGMTKLEWCGYPMVEAMLFVLMASTNVTDGQHRSRLQSIARQKLTT